MDNVILRLAPFPPHVNAVVVLDDDDDYNIYVNSALSEDERITAFEHEKAHIIEQHFYCEKPIHDCETEARERGGRYRGKKKECCPRNR